MSNSESIDAITAGASRNSKLSILSFALYVEMTLEIDDDDDDDVDEEIYDNAVLEILRLVIMPNSKSIDEITAGVSRNSKFSILSFALSVEMTLGIDDDDDDHVDEEILQSIMSRLNQDRAINEKTLTDEMQF
eukprot:CAMPEP_0194443326 /NCGR_PEP_ID=MMETSP0176-20130528/126639_1 /TAXON_ID=216777 /ORGANISM="Proboscia alata, Strain PI-D3" /LENGTH=132 /DNA_ID=CAMNT_0039269553 /DNA_START=307 /DNA_END=704 /DNA_ORIENTATION=-